jgi:4-amino-4-deoxy-L-arabinose transferase-like glycosyltransferase
MPWMAVGALVACYGVLYGVCLGLAPIGGSSEAREAQVIEVILRENTWILPLRNGIVPSKPILFHWIGALWAQLCSKTFGVHVLSGPFSELCVRLPSLLCALVTMVLAALVGNQLARRCAGWECALHPRHVALLTAALLPLIYGFHVMAGLAMVDMCFCCTVWIAFAGLSCANHDYWRECGRISSGARGVFWLGCAAAVLARGPVGVLLPVFVVGVTGVAVVGLRRTVAELARPSVGWIAFALPAAWYCAAYGEGGDAFMWRQLLFENVRRFLGGENINAEAWWFYLPSLLRNTFPWGVVAIAAWWCEWRRNRALSTDVRRNLRLLSAPGIALLAALLLLSASSGKRHSYLLPLYPLFALQLALLIVVAVARAGSASRARGVVHLQRLQLVIAALGVVLLFGMAGASLPLSQSSALLCQLQRIVAAVAPVVGTVLCVAVAPALFPDPQQLRVQGVLTWAGMVSILVAISSIGAAVKGELKGFNAISAEWRSFLSPGEQLAVIKGKFDEYFDPLLWYVHAPVEVLSSEQGGVPCSADKVYLAHLDWLNRSAQMIEGRVVELATVYEHGRRLRGLRDKGMVIFRCVPQAAPASEQMV